MIEEIISVLLAPLTTLLANSSLLTAMGSGVSAIGLYDTDLPVTTSTTDIADCYVRLYDSGVVSRSQDFMGGATRMYTDIGELMIEYVAYGSTARQVNQRINQLKIAVENQVRATLSNPGSIQITNPTGGSGYVKVQTVHITTANQVPNSGPNKDPAVPQWKRPRYSKVEITIGHMV